MFVRTEDWWRHRRLADPEWGREGGGEMVRALLELDGRPAAYALYRLHFSAVRGTPTGFTSVIEAIGDSPERTREIWRYLLGHRLDGTRPRAAAAARPRAVPAPPRAAPAQLRVSGRALGAPRGRRGGAERAELQAGRASRYRASSTSSARGTRAAGGLDSTAPRGRMPEAELAMPVESLGSAYLGGFSFGQLARAGRVEELAEGALDRADGLFRADRYPWCPEIF